MKRFGKISLGREHTYALQKHSIEDYLLVPRAIKKAYPKMSLSEKRIDEFLLENRLKKNKKYVLETLFEKAGPKAYGKNCASSIAHEIEDHEIKDELAQLLARICHLQKLQ